MGCGSSCGTGSGKPAGCKSNGGCDTGGCNKLNVFDWLANMQLPEGQAPFNVVEVRFKNSRKEFYKKETGVELQAGDVVAVEASPGHDIGVVSLTGELVRLQLKKKNVSVDSDDIKKIYRKARPADIEKWEAARGLETETMFKARTIAVRLKLNMKISDVEYQGDKTKAIFYYTADERVDFRELIKLLADEFKVRIEMKQIGLRQEAGRLGGIGSCGRELCCSTWLTDFRTVSTSAARYQQLSLNPLKLAGQCGKLKCCLNYELDSYLDELKDFPEGNLKLETAKGRAFHQKTDIFKRLMWYSYADDPGKFLPVSVDRVKEIIEMNKQGINPDDLPVVTQLVHVEKSPDYENVVGQDSLTRFDQKKKKKKKKKRPEGSGKDLSELVPAQSKNLQQSSGPAERRPEQRERKPGDNQRRPGQGKPNNPERRHPAPRPEGKPEQQASGNDQRPNERRNNKRRPQNRNQNRRDGNTNTEPKQSE